MARVCFLHTGENPALCGTILFSRAKGLTLIIVVHASQNLTFNLFVRSKRNFFLFLLRIRRGKHIVLRESNQNSISAIDG